MMLSIRRPQYEDSLFHPAMRFVHPCTDLGDILLPASMMALLGSSIPKKQCTGQKTCAKRETSNFEVKVDVQHFLPEELDVKTVDNHIVVTGRHEEKQDEHGYVSRQFVRRYAIPEGVKAESVTCNLSSDGVLLISAPMPLEKAPANEVKIPISLAPRPEASQSTSSPQEDPIQTSKDTSENFKQSEDASSQ